MEYERRNAEKRRLLLQFGSACDACGYNRIIRALHFHHVDSSEKRDWNGGTGRASLVEVASHPERFRVLCATCHIEVHEKVDAENRMYVKCRHCGARVQTRPSLIANGRKQYCSKEHEVAHRAAAAQTRLHKRVFKYVDKTSTCWLWTGYTVKNQAGGKTGALMVTAPDSSHKIITARSLVYGFETGLTPPVRLFASCGNTLCVAPAHCTTHSAQEGKPGPTPKLTADQARTIRQRYAAGGISQMALAREYGMGQPAIGELIRRETWKHLS